MINSQSELNAIEQIVCKMTHFNDCSPHFSTQFLRTKKLQVYFLSSFHLNQRENYVLQRRQSTEIEVKNLKMYSYTMLLNNLKKIYTTEMYNLELE